MKTHYVYIPGLGNKNNILRRLLIATWQWRMGVNSHLVPISWIQGVPVAQMCGRITDFVCTLPKSDTVILVGESAGGALAIIAGLENDRISGVVTICGKNIRAHTLGKGYLERYASLYDAVEMSEALLRKRFSYAQKKVAILYSDHDLVISKESTTLKGLPTKVFHSPGHLFSIAWIGMVHFGYIRGIFGNVS